MYSSPSSSIRFSWFARFVAYVQYGVMPLGASPRRRSSGRWWWWEVVMLAVDLLRMETRMGGSASPASLLNKLGIWLGVAVLLDSGHHGGGQTWGAAGSGDIGEDVEASPGGDSKQRRVCVGAIFGRWGRSTPRGFYSDGLSSSRPGGSSASARRSSSTAHQVVSSPMVRTAAGASRPAATVVEEDLIAFQESVRGPLCKTQGPCCNFSCLGVLSVTVTHHYE